MTHREIRALIAYLKSVNPSIAAPVRQLDTIRALEQLLAEAAEKA